MKGLRTQHEGRPYRTFLAFNPRRSAILLIGGDKTGDDRFYERMLPLADALFDAYLVELKRRRRAVMAGHKPWSTLQDKISPERQNANAEAARRIEAEMVLAELRKHSGMAQTQLADILGISQPTLSK